MVEDVDEVEDAAPVMVGEDPAPASVVDVSSLFAVHATTTKTRASAGRIRRGICETIPSRLAPVSRWSRLRAETGHVLFSKHL